MKNRWALMGFGKNGRELIGKDHPAGPMLSRFRLIQTPIFGIYLHFIYREDMDRSPHNHPWFFVSLILRGGYVEEYRPDTRHVRQYARRHGHGSLHAFPPRAAHRITEVQPHTTTLVFTGRQCQRWGFFEPTGFRRHGS